MHEKWDCIQEWIGSRIEIFIQYITLNFLLLWFYIRFLILYWYYLNVSLRWMLVQYLARLLCFRVVSCTHSVLAHLTVYCLCNSISSMQAVFIIVLVVAGGKTANKFQWFYDFLFRVSHHVCYLQPLYFH